MKNQRKRPKLIQALKVFLFAVMFGLHGHSEVSKVVHHDDEAVRCDHGNLAHAEFPLDEVDRNSAQEIEKIKRPDLSHLLPQVNSSAQPSFFSKDFLQQNNLLPKKVQMRVLFLSATNDPLIEPEIPIAIQTIKAFGIPFDHISLIENGVSILKDNLSLEESLNIGKYYAIVLSTGQLVYQDKDSKWKSALTSEQWHNLDEYEIRYQVRRVSLNTWPAAYLGLKLGGSPGSNPVDIILSKNLGDYASGMVPELFSNLQNSWQTPAKIIDTSMVKPVFYFGTNNESDSSGEKPLAAAIVNLPDQREQMHFFFVQSKYSMPSLIAGPLWLRWVTHGIYLGKRRTYLNAQIDDFFLNTDRWDPYNLRNPGDNSRGYRLHAEDMAEFTKYRKDKLIPTSGYSKFSIELAFNGFGVWEARGYRKDPLFMASRKLAEEFNWVSHTYSHLDLNLFNYERSMIEFNKNKEMTKDLFGSEDHSYFSSQSMVTPRISGLFVGEVLKAMIDSKIFYAAGDTTRPEITPENMYVGRWTTKEFNGHDGVLIIPRNATEIYYDVTNVTELESEYNNRYRKYFGKDLTYKDIYQREGDRVVRNLLRLEPTPNMFHQTNLRAFVLPDSNLGESQKRVSLISLWLDTVLGEYRKYSTLPVSSLKFDDIAANFVHRMEYEKCGFAAYVSIVEGKYESIEGQSQNKCQVNITSDLSTNLIITNPPNENSVTAVVSENYGPDHTVTFESKPNQKVYFKFNNNFSLIKNKGPLL